MIVGSERGAPNVSEGYDAYKCMFVRMTVCVQSNGTPDLTANRSTGVRGQSAASCCWAGSISLLWLIVQKVCTPGKTKMIKSWQEELQARTQVRDSLEISWQLTEIQLKKGAHPFLSCWKKSSILCKAGGANGRYCS